MFKNTAEDWKKLGDDYYKEGKYTKARDAYNSGLIIVSPRQADEKTLNTGAHEKVDYKTLFKACILDCYLKESDDWREQGDAYYNKGKYNKAIDAYNHALIIASQEEVDDNVRINTLKNRILACYLEEADDCQKQGDAYYNKGKYNKAIDAYNHALTIASQEEVDDTARSSALKNRILTCYLEETDRLFKKNLYDQAKKFIDDALKLYPTNETIQSYWWDKSFQSFVNGEYKKKEIAYDYAMATCKTNEREIVYWLQIADYLFEQDFVADAKKNFDVAKKIDPENKINQRYWWDKYNESCKKHAYYKSNIAWRYALATYPKSLYAIKTWLKRADRLFEKNHFGASRKAFDEAWEIDPANKLNQRYWLDKYIEACSKGEDKKAKQAFKFSKIYYTTTMNLNGYQFPNGDLSQNGNITTQQKSNPQTLSLNQQHMDSTSSSGEDTALDSESLITLSFSCEDAFICTSSKPSSSKQSLLRVIPGIFDNSRNKLEQSKKKCKLAVVERNPSQQSEGSSLKKDSHQSSSLQQCSLFKQSPHSSLLKEDNTTSESSQVVLG